MKAPIIKTKRNHRYVEVQTIKTEITDSETSTIENNMLQSGDDYKDQSEESEILSRPMEEESLVDQRLSSEIDTDDENNMEVKSGEQSDAESMRKDKNPGGQTQGGVSDSQTTDKKGVSFSHILNTVAEKAMESAVPQKQLPKRAQPQMQSILNLKSQSVTKDIQSKESEPEGSDSKSSVVIVFSGNVNGQPKLYPRERHSSGRSLISQADGTSNQSEGSPDDPAAETSCESPSSDSMRVLEVAQVLSELSQISPALPMASVSDHQSHPGMGLKRGRMDDDDDDDEEGFKRSKMQADLKSVISGLVVDEAIKEKLGITAEMDEATQNLLLLAEQISQENIAVMVRQKSVEVTKKNGDDTEADAAAGPDRAVKTAEDIWVQIDPSQQHKDPPTAKETARLRLYNPVSNQVRRPGPENAHCSPGALDLLCEAVNAAKSDETEADISQQVVSLGLVKQEPIEWVEVQPESGRGDCEQGPSSARGAVREKDSSSSEEGGHLSMMKSANNVPAVKFVHLDLFNWKIGGKLVKKLTDHPVGLLLKRGITRELALSPSVTTVPKASLIVGEFLELYFTALWFQHSGIKINSGHGSITGKFCILHKWLQMFYGLTDSIMTVKSRTESILDMYMAAEENYKTDLSLASFYCLQNFLTSSLQWQLPPTSSPPPQSQQPSKTGGSKPLNVCLLIRGRTKKGSSSPIQGSFPQLMAKLHETQTNTSTSIKEEMTETGKQGEEMTETGKQGEEMTLTGKQGEESDEELSSVKSDDEKADSPPAATNKQGRPKSKRAKVGKYRYNLPLKKKNAPATEKRSAHSTSYKRPYSPSFRLRVLKFAESYGNNSAASRKFGVSVRQIRKWRERKGEIYKQAGLQTEEDEEGQEEDPADLDPELGENSVIGVQGKKKYSSHTPVGRQRLRPWLTQRIGSLRFPGLEWIDRDTEIFKIPWKHWKNSGWLESDSLIFKEWAINTGRFHPREKPEWAAWKTRLRCALNQMPNITELKNMRSKKSKTPYRVFKFVNKDRKDDDDGVNNPGALYPVVHSDVRNIPTLVTELAEAETVIKMEPLSPSDDPPVLPMEVDLPSGCGTCTRESHPLDSPPPLSSTSVSPSLSSKGEHQRMEKPKTQPEDSVPTQPTKDGLAVGLVNGGASQENIVPVPSIQLSKDANIESRQNMSKDQASICSTEDSDHSEKGLDYPVLIKSTKDNSLMSSSAAEDKVKHDQTTNSGSGEHRDPPVHLDKDGSAKPSKNVRKTKHSRKGGSSKCITKDTSSKCSIKDDSAKSSEKKLSPKHSSKDGPPKHSKDDNHASSTKDAMPSPPMPLTKDDTHSRMVDCSPDEAKSSISPSVVSEEPEDEESQAVGASSASNEDCVVFYMSI